MRSAADQTAPQVGSLEYTAPEVFLMLPMTRKSDVYSFGLLLWELFALGEQPFMEVRAYLSPRLRRRR